jgi:hypothetical protein
MTILNIGKDGRDGASIFVVWFDKGGREEEFLSTFRDRKDDDSPPTLTNWVFCPIFPALGLQSV